MDTHDNFNSDNSAEAQNDWQLREYDNKANAEKEAIDLHSAEAEGYGVGSDYSQNRVRANDRNDDEDDDDDDDASDDDSDNDTNEDEESGDWGSVDPQENGLPDSNDPSAPGSAV